MSQAPACAATGPGSAALTDDLRAGGPLRLITRGRPGGGPADSHGR